MKKWWITFAVAALFIPTAALAATFQANQNVPSGETIVGNLYLVGATPTMNGTVQGDLYTAGGNVVVTGGVAEDLVVAGGNINVSGMVGGDLRVMGGSIFVDSQVNGEVLVTGGDVTIGPNAQIRKDLAAAGGTVNIDPNAKIFGSQMIETGEKYEKEYDKMSVAFDHFSSAAFWTANLFVILGFFIVAAVFLGLFPNVLKKWATKGLSKGQFWPSVGLGFLLLVVTPIAAAILISTIIGAFPGAILLVLYTVYILLSMSLAGILFGELLKRWFTKAKKVEPSWAWGLGGIVVLHLLTLVPFVGWIIGLLFFLFTWGTVVTVQWKVARSLK